MTAAVAAASLTAFANPALAGPAADPPVIVCAEGALSVVTDDSGVQHQACVAVGDAVVPPGPDANVVEAAVVVPAELAPTGSAPQLPQTGSSGSSLIIAALLVGSGSVASFISRRKR